MTGLAVAAIDHIVLNVLDTDVSAEWYTRVLGMKHEKIIPKDGQAPRNVLFFGRQRINLRPKSASQEEWFTAKNIESGTSDLCFLVQVPPNAVIDHLKSQGIEIELGPVFKEGALGKIHSVYCRDPDGSLIELSSYET